MSMNLHLEASAMATIKLPNGKKKRQKVVEKFDLWQTPTSITYKCLAGNTYELYKEWVMSFKEEYCNKTSNGTWEKVDYDVSEYHIEQLDEWLKCHEGWKIEWFLM